MMIEGTGRIALREHTFYYASPAEAEVRIIDLKEGIRRTVAIPDPEFSVEAVEPGDIPPDEAAAYLFGNSRVVGVFALDDYIVAEVVDGAMEVVRGGMTMTGKKVIGRENRKTKLYIYDGNMELVDYFVLDHKLRTSIGRLIKGVYNNSMYFVHTSIDEQHNELTRTLTILKIESSGQESESISAKQP